MFGEYIFFDAYATHTEKVSKTKKKYTKLTSVCTVHASKFFNQQNLNKSSNDYMGPIMQAFLLFFSLFRMRCVCVYCLCVPLSVLF